MLTEVWVHLHLICAGDACGTVRVYFGSHLDQKLVWRTRDQKVTMLLEATLERDILMGVLISKEIQTGSLEEIHDKIDKHAVPTNSSKLLPN